MTAPWPPPVVVGRFPDSLYTIRSSLLYQYPRRDYFFFNVKRFCYNLVRHLSRARRTGTRATTRRPSAAHCMTIPPSIGIVCPVMYSAASSSARKRTRPATSSAVPILCMRACVCVCAHVSLGGGRDRSGSVYRTDEAHTNTGAMRTQAQGGGGDYLCIGMVLRTASLMPSLSTSVISVAMYPGQTALHLMPRFAYSRATLLVSPITPAFAAA